MYKFFAGLSVLALLLLTACEARETRPVAAPEEEARATEPAEPEDQQVGEPAEPADRVAGEPAEPADRQAVEPQEPAARDEFYGQTPEHGTIPETVVLEARNGNITLTHAAHAARIECATCHGEGAPGAIELDRDSGHKLCMGCHEQQGAGPVKCAECHVRE
jgi:hypothetical protein